MAAVNKISVDSLKPLVKDGWLTKQGGSIRTWKKRWFVLKDDKLYYFKGQKDVDMTGYIQFEQGASCKEEVYDIRKKKHCFSVKPSNDAKRVYYIHADRAEDAKAWVSKINEQIQRSLGGASPDPSPTPAAAAAPTPTPDPTPVTPSTPTPATTDTPSREIEKEFVKDGKTPRDLVQSAKNEVGFLKEDDSKVLEFWQIWFESIPTDDELSNNVSQIDFTVSTSAKMEKLTWRTAGPQNLFIQKMVDFFWNVGAPETEIDRLNDVGTLLNPVRIGSWIDMSARGGMDGGWYFPVTLQVSLVLEAADPGDPVTKVSEWSERHGVTSCYSVGRDMGAAPPRQTEFRVSLPGNDLDQQIKIARDAYTSFGFPEPPADAITMLSDSGKIGLCLSIITSSEGFVRLGVLLPEPSDDMIVKACQLAGANKDNILKFKRSLNVETPSFLEFQYLKEGFGYGVYPEGFDVVFHFAVGEIDDE
eukprot:TRINITY_DN3515_c0_g1_i1.p1 TRINITY_DN3515_c0_g1~~TRINITY_DN3515_c0_g1_i1.p1  ORF type:complete len:474 (+),score=210.16 TRINITY_DN3515_c0_g1_i1:78-1499(+)